MDLAYRAPDNKESVQSVLIIQCFMCKVSLLYSALYAKFPYYLLPYMQQKHPYYLLLYNIMQSVLIVCYFPG